MARPREFDKEAALKAAMHAFWEKGFAATSTEDLIQAMGIGRQSVYNTFGDKRQLFLDALGFYLKGVSEAHLARLNAPSSPLDGIKDLFDRLTPEEDCHNRRGCMAVCSIAEFGATDPPVIQLIKTSTRPLFDRLVERIREGQASGEIDPKLDAYETAGFVRATMDGLQVAARAGIPRSEVAILASFAIDRLKKR